MSKRPARVERSPNLSPKLSAISWGVDNHGKVFFFMGNIREGVDLEVFAGGYIELERKFQILCAINALGIPDSFLRAIAQAISAADWSDIGISTWMKGMDRDAA